MILKYRNKFHLLEYILVGGFYMDKKEKFKEFIANHPELVGYIQRKEMTFQDFYEIYDIYGEDNSAWSKYFDNEDNRSKEAVLSELTGLFKGINLDSIQNHVNNAQKAINIIQELTKKTPEVLTKVERPITKFYGD